MGVTVFHSLTATTPDNTQYEIRPSHWNSNHVVSLSLQGSDISNAFTNSPTVTFGSSGAYVTASVNTSYIALSNSSSIMPVASSSNFLGSAASGSFINTSVSSSIMPVASSSNFLGTGATGSFINTSVSSSIMPIASSSNFINTSVSSSIMPIASSSNFVNTSVSSRFAGTGTTFSGTNVSGSMTLNSNGLNLALSAGAGGGGSFSAGISTGGNTAGTTGTVSNQIVFVGGNNVTLSGSTAAGGATVTISGANIGGAQTGISGVAVSNTTYTSGTFSFRDGNNISFASGTGQAISITHNLQSAGAYLTTAAQSNQVVNSLNGSTGQISLNVGSSLSASTLGSAVTFGLASNITTALQSAGAYLTTAAQSNQVVNSLNGSTGQISLNVGSSLSASTLGSAVTFGLASNITTALQSAGAYLTTAAQSSASNVSLVIAGTAAAGGTASLSGGVSFSNANGISFYTSAGNAIVASYSVPTVPTAYVSSVNGSSGAISLNVGSSLSASTNGSSITFGLASNITTALQSAGAYLTTAAQSSASNVSQVVVGTAAAGGTATLTGGVSFSNANGISFYSSAGNAVVASYTVPTAPTAYVSSVNGSSGAISLNVGSSLSASTNGSSVTFGLASNITTALQSAGAYLTTAMQSQSSSAFAGTGSAFTNLTATYNTLGLSISAPAVSLISGTGAVSVSVTGSTISIGAPAMSIGVSGGNTSGNSGTVSNQFVLAGGNNITLSGSTNAAGMTVTVSANTAAAANLSISAGASSGAFGGITFANSNNVTFGLNNGTITASVPAAGGAQTGISGLVVSNTTYTSGTVSFRDGNGLTFASGTGQGVSLTHALLFSSQSSLFQSTGAYLTTAAQSNQVVNSLNGSTGQISLNVGSSLSASTLGSAVTFGLASNITTALQSAGAYLTTAAQSSASNVSQVIAGTAAAGGTATLTGGVSFSNANGISFYTSAGNAIVASYSVPTVPTAYVSSVNGSSGAISLNVGSSLSASTNGSSVTFGLASNITTALQSAGAYLTTAAQSSASNVSQVIVGTAAAGGTATLTGGVSFSNANGISFYSSAGNAVVASYSVPTVPTSYVSNVNGISGGVSLNVGSSLSANTLGSAITFGLASNITTALQSAGPYLTTAAQSNQVVNSLNGSAGQISLNVGSSLSANTLGSAITFGLASNITTALQSAGAYLTTAAQSSASNVSLAIAATNNTGGGTGSLSGGVSFSNANGLTFYTSAGNAIVGSYTVPTVPTSYVSNVNGSSGAVSVAGTGFTSTTTGGTAVVATLSTNGLSMGIPAYITTYASQTAQTANFYATGVNTTQLSSTAGVDLRSISISGAGGATAGVSNGIILVSSPIASVISGVANITVGVTGSTIGLSAAAGGGANFSAGVSTGGNTAGNTGTVSNQLVLAGGNNITLSGSTGAGGMTLTISGANAAGAQTGISSIAVSNTTYTSGQLSFRDGNNISFASGTGQAISITHNLQSAGAYLTTAAQSNQVINSLNGSTGQISLNVGSSLSASTLGSAITFGLASNITTALQSAGAYLTTAAQSSASNVSLAIAATNNTGGGTASLSGGVSFSNANGLTFYTSAGNAIVGSYSVPTVPTAYVSSVNGSSGAISFNVGSSLSASTNGSSITFGLASNITTALQSAGAYLTTAAQSSASNVSQVIVGTAAAGGTATLTGGVSFSNANGISFYSSAGNAVVASYSVPTVPTAYVSSVNGSSGAISLNVGSSLSASTNGSSITFGLASNITTALQSAGAYLTTAAQSSASNVSLIIAGTAAAGGTASLSGGVSFSNANGISFYTSAGNAVVASYSVPTVPTSYVSNVNGSSGAVNVAGLGFTSTTTAGTAVVATLSTNGLSMAVPQFLTAAGGAQTAISGIVVSNTTYTSGTVSFRDGNNISFASGTGQGISITHNLQSAGAYLTTAMQSQSSSVFAKTGFTSTTTAGTAIVATHDTNGLSMGIPAYITTAPSTAGLISAINVSAGTTSNNLSAITFANTAGNVTFGMAGSVITASAPSGGGGGGVAIAASNTTFTSGTVVMSAAGGALTISSGAQSVLMSVPQTSSIVAGSGVALSTNGSTIYLYNDFHDIFVPNMVGASTTFNHGTSTGGNGTIQFVPLYPVDNYSFTCFDINISIPVTSTAVATYSGGETMSYALYKMDTANASRMTLVQSSSMFIRMSMSSNLSGAYTVNFNNSATSYSSSSAGATAVITELAGRPVVLRMPFAGTLQAGEVYYLGFGQSNQTGGASVLLPPVRSYGVIPANTNQMGYIGPDTRGGTSNGMDFMGFVYSTTSGAFPGTISTNQTQLNSSGFVPFVVFKNII